MHPSPNGIINEQSFNPPNTRWMLNVSQEPVFLFFELVFPQKSPRFAIVVVVVECICRSWSRETKNVRDQKSSAALSQLPSRSESAPLINHFSSEKSGGTVTDSKISQEKNPLTMMKSRFKARSTRMQRRFGWESLWGRPGVCFVGELIFKPSADSSRL